MNKLFILVLCGVISSISAETYVFQVKGKDLLNLLDVAARCNVEADTPKDSMLMVLHNEYPETDAFKKFIPCWLTKTGFADGNAFVLDKCTAPLADQSQAESLKTELEKCNTEVASSDTKPYDLMKCFNKLDSKFTV